MAIGKGIITRTPHMRVRILLALHILWVILVCALGAWWSRLMLHQASRIAALETQMGTAAGEVQREWISTQNMLFWESTAFFVFLIASMILFFWLYWSDFRRARSMQAFFASVTHELRTPLTSIRLQAESLADEVSRDGSEIAKGSRLPLAERLLEDTTRLELQVERMLELARVEGGGKVFIQPLDLRSITDRVVKQWHQTFGGQLGSGRKLKIYNQVDDFQIEADPTAFQVILRNLLDNSYKHSKNDDVKIHLKSHRDSTNRISLVIYDNNSFINIQPHEIGSLFGKGEASQGTGVGLYLVKTLMKRMRGEVLFRIKLPEDQRGQVSSGFEVQLVFQEAKSDAGP